MKAKRYFVIFIISLFLLSAPTGEIFAQAVMSQSETEQQVRDYFADEPVMIEIARCESKFRQFTDAGKVLRGGYNNAMVGVFQFYESVHSTEANTLGHDITTLDGNLAYARHLYEQSGTEPWNASRSCWENAVPSAELEPKTTDTTQTATDAELREKIAMLKQLISLLQTLLALQGSEDAEKWGQLLFKSFVFGGRIQLTRRQEFRSLHDQYTLSLFCFLASQNSWQGLRILHAKHPMLCSLGARTTKSTS